VEGRPAGVRPGAHRRRGKRLTHDLEYRIELGYCVTHGIPRSLFLGRPQPAQGEPLWLDRDRDEVVGYLLWEEAQEAERAAEMAKLCPDCRTDPTSWPKGFAEAPPFEPVITECPGCRVIAEAWAALSGHDMDPTAGMHMALAPFDPEGEDHVGPHVEMVTQRRQDQQLRQAETAALNAEVLQAAQW
jgi:hypothetical protein